MLEDLDLEAVRNQIDPELLKVQGDDAALKLLLARRALPGVLFAAPPPFWNRVREQFRLFLCTDDEHYRELRKEYKQRGREATVGLVGALAGYIATITGVAVGVLTSFIALLLFTAMTIGVSAYCAAPSVAGVQGHEPLRG